MFKVISFELFTFKHEKVKDEIIVHIHEYIFFTQLFFLNSKKTTIRKYEPSKLLFHKHNENGSTSLGFQLPMYTWVLFIFFRFVHFIFQIILSNIIHKYLINDKLMLVALSSKVNYSCEHLW
jgi:hypothetical protein